MQHMQHTTRGVPEGFFATGSGSGKNGPKSGFTGSGSGLLATPTTVGYKKSKTASKSDHSFRRN